MSDILDLAPVLWPSSFPRAVAGTRVLTWIFKSDDPNIETFLNYIKEKGLVPSILIGDNGYTSVTTTATADCGYNSDDGQDS